MQATQNTNRWVPFCCYDADTLRRPVTLVAGVHHYANWNLCHVMKTMELCTFFSSPVPNPRYRNIQSSSTLFHTALLLIVYFPPRECFPSSCLSSRPSLLISFGLSTWLLAAGLHCSHIFISCTRLEQTNALTTVFSNYINFTHWCLYFLPFQFRSVMWKLALFLCLLWCSESSLSSHMVLIA